MKASLARSSFYCPTDFDLLHDSAYNYFFREERARWLAEQKTQGQRDDLFSAMGKTIAARWKQISPQEADRYEQLAAQDMERYRREMYQYHAVKGRERMIAEGKVEPSPSRQVSAGPAPSTLVQALVHQTSKSPSGIHGQSRALDSSRQSLTSSAASIHAESGDNLAFRMRPSFSGIQAQTAASSPSLFGPPGTGADYPLWRYGAMSTAHLAPSDMALKQSLLRQQQMQQQMQVQQLLGARHSQDILAPSLRGSMGLGDSSSSSTSGGGAYPLSDRRGQALRLFEEHPPARTERETLQGLYARETQLAEVLRAQEALRAQQYQQRLLSRRLEPSIGQLDNAVLRGALDPNLVLWSVPSGGGRSTAAATTSREDDERVIQYLLRRQRELEEEQKGDSRHR